MSKTVIDHLSHLVSPTTSGIIWLTDDTLNSSLAGVYELNYLMNGLLTKSIAAKDSQSKSSSNFFLAENFGNPFFLGHSVISNKEDLKNMHKHIELAKPLFNGDEDNIEVYIFNRSKNTANTNILKELSHKYRDIKFENLNI